MKDPSSRRIFQQARISVNGDIMVNFQYLALAGEAESSQWLIIVVLSLLDLLSFGSFCKFVV